MSSRMLRVAIVTVAAVLAVPTAAQANWELAADGHPRVTLPQLYEGGEIRVCPPGGAACTKVDGTVHEPGETAVGTTFEI